MASSSGVEGVSTGLLVEFISSGGLSTGSRVGLEGISPGEGVEFIEDVVSDSVECSFSSVCFVPVVSDSVYYFLGM